ncbi:MAG: hypothetical protein R2747_07465 [Pyrinomonadaceae bacterium]
MNKFIEFLKKIFWLAVFVLIWGTVGGLALFLTVIISRYGYFVALSVTAFFSLFHLSDLKTFFAERNWMAFAGRLFCLYVLGAFIGGFVAFASGLKRVSLDRLDHIILAGCFVFSFSVMAFWVILANFFDRSRLYRDIQKIVEGLKVIGVFWKDY